VKVTLIIEACTTYHMAHTLVPWLCEKCRYEAVVAIIGGAYCIVQLPFAIYYAVQQKRLIRNGFLPEFDFFGDKVLPLSSFFSIASTNVHGKLKETLYEIAGNLCASGHRSWCWFWSIFGVQKVL